MGERGRGSNEAAGGGLPLSFSSTQVHIRI